MLFEIVHQRYLKILFLCLLLNQGLAYAQVTRNVSVYLTDKSNEKAISKPDYYFELVDTNRIEKVVFGVLTELAEQSYLLPQITSKQTDSNLVTYYINKGKSFNWLQLNYQPDDIDELRAAGWRVDLFNGKKFSSVVYAKQINLLLTFLEQNGYPFASVQLDSILFDSTGIKANLLLNKGQAFYFDTVEVIGNAKIKSWFVQKYLGIKKDALYNEKLVNAMDYRLASLPYIQSMRSSLVYFVQDKAKPAVYLTPKKSSTFDGVIGFAPASPINQNKLLITGEANLKLQNLFATGKSLQIGYKSYLSGTQDLKLSADLPYIFKSNLGVGYQLALLKFDSSFLDVKNEFSLLYLIKGNDYARVLFGVQNTSLISVDTNLIKATKSLPATNDLVVRFYGLGVKFTHYDYALNPRKGYGVNFTGGFGNKVIVKNATINQIKFTNQDGSTQSIYDTMDLKSIQYKLNVVADLFIPLYQKLTFRGEFQGGFLETSPVFLNELFRIGGLSTLKGFDEQSIFANQYGILNTEIRYLLQQNSHFLLFWNGAWYKNALNNATIIDTPFGFGAGLNLETKAGVLSLFYAVGKQLSNPIEFSKAKIHFGIVNYF